MSLALNRPSRAAEGAADSPARRLRAAWARLAPRERRLVALATSVVALALLWLLALSPALRTLRQAEVQRAELAAEAQRMQQLQSEAAALKALPKLGHDEAVRALEAAVKQRWEELKAEERAEKAAAPEQLSLLDDVPTALPALSRAAKLQKRAAQVGFDWPEALPVVDKVREELDEVLEAMSENDAGAIAEEIGDLLFVVTNLARHLKVDPEAALRAANGKFERRFRHIEQALREAGRPIENCSLEELDALWGEAKKLEKLQPGC